MRLRNLIVFDKDMFKNEGLSGLWNKMAKESCGDIIAMVGDDMIFKTNAWDSKIIDICCCYFVCY